MSSRFYVSHASSKSYDSSSGYGSSNVGYCSSSNESAAKRATASNYTYGMRGDSEMKYDGNDSYRYDNGRDVGANYANVLRVSMDDEFDFPPPPSPPRESLPTDENLVDSVATTVDARTLLGARRTIANNSAMHHRGAATNYQNPIIIKTHSPDELPSPPRFHFLGNTTARNFHDNNNYGNSGIYHHAYSKSTPSPLTSYAPFSSSSGNNTSSATACAQNANENDKTLRTIGRGQLCFEEMDERISRSRRAQHYGREKQQQQQQPHSQSQSKRQQPHDNNRQTQQQQQHCDSNCAYINRDHSLNASFSSTSKSPYSVAATTPTHDKSLAYAAILVPISNEKLGDFPVAAADMRCGSNNNATQISGANNNNNKKHNNSTMNVGDKNCASFESKNFCESEDSALPESSMSMSPTSSSASTSSNGGRFKWTSGRNKETFLHASLPYSASGVSEADASRSQPDNFLKNNRHSSYHDGVAPKYDTTAATAAAWSASAATQQQQQQFGYGRWVRAANGKWQRVGSLGNASEMIRAHSVDRFAPMKHNKVNAENTPFASSFNAALYSTNSLQQQAESQQQQQQQQQAQQVRQRFAPLPNTYNDAGGCGGERRSSLLLPQSNVASAAAENDNDLFGRELDVNVWIRNQQKQRQQQNNDVSNKSNDVIWQLRRPTPHDPSYQDSIESRSIQNVNQLVKQFSTTNINNNKNDLAKIDNNNKLNNKINNNHQIDFCYSNTYDLMSSGLTTGNKADNNNENNNKSNNEDNKEICIQNNKIPLVSTLSTVLTTMKTTVVERAADCVANDRSIKEKQNDINNNNNDSIDNDSNNNFIKKNDNDDSENMSAELINSKRVDASLVSHLDVENARRQTNDSDCRDDGARILSNEKEATERPGAAVVAATQVSRKIIEKQQTDKNNNNKSNEKIFDEKWRENIVTDEQYDEIRGWLTDTEFYQYDIFTVTLTRTSGVEDGSVGLILTSAYTDAGLYNKSGQNVRDNSEYITIQRVITGSVADYDNRLQKGDRVFFIQHKSTRNMSAPDARTLLKSPARTVTLVVGRVNLVTNSAPTTAFGQMDANFSDIFSGDPALECYDTEPTHIVLQKTDLGVGLSLDGGRSSRYGDRPIVVKKVFAVGSAAKSGKINAGDVVHAIDGQTLAGLTQLEAWKLLKSKSEGGVRFEIRKRIVASSSPS